MARIFAFISVVLVLGVPLSAAAEQSFERWVEVLKQEARGRGISQATLDEALRGVKPIARVIELDRKQPEFTLTFEEYLARVVPQVRQDKARNRLATHRALLTEIGEAYGVQPRFIVALWGIETDFGRVMGSFDVIAALASLAYDGRRSEFFRKELLHALRIIDEGHIEAADMKGSWAGAMGQSQFMPSSFNHYAQDYDGDGKKDIWATRADVFASAAYYLKQAGWRDDMTWGRAVQLPQTGSASYANALSLHHKKTWKTLDEWAMLGVRTHEGQALPPGSLKARLVVPAEKIEAGEQGAEQGGNEAVYLVYANFESILRWNRSNYFAIAVGTLADSMR